jgi:hypothetical protein
MEAVRYERKDLPTLKITNLTNYTGQVLFVGSIFFKNHTEIIHLNNT